MAEDSLLSIEKKERGGVENLFREGKIGTGLTCGPLITRIIKRSFRTV